MKIKINPCPCCGKLPEFDDEDSPFQIWCDNPECVDRPVVQSTNEDLCAQMWNLIPNKYVNNNEFREFEVGSCAYPDCENCIRYDYCKLPNKKSELSF